jgi:hypothetical protein
MSNKQYPEFKAKPFGESVDAIAPMLNKMLNSKHDSDHAGLLDLNPLDGRDDLIATLKGMVNPDVCLTKTQQDRLFTDMREYLKSPDQIKLLAMVAVINSYRTECAKCLNKDCTIRDMHDVE